MEQPEKSGAENRTIIVRLRVKLSEKIKLQTNAAEAGVSISDWIRKQSIGATPLLQKPNPDRELLHRLLAELGKQGSNLNQIARHFNRKEEGADIPLSLINLVLQEIKMLTDHIRKLLTNGHQR